jgi:hypothetical protein
MKNYARIEEPWLTISRAIFGVLYATMLLLLALYFMHNEAPLVDLIFIGGISLAYLTTALIIYWRASEYVIGFVTAVMLLILGPHLFSGVNNTNHWTWSSTWTWTAVSGLLALIGTTASAFFVILFPNGRLVPRWGVWFLLPLLGSFALSLARDGLAGQTSALTVFIIIVVVLVGIGTQVYRYIYVSSPSERQQTKWVLAGFVGVAATVTYWFVADMLLHVYEDTLIVTIPVVLLVCLLPVSIAISILRYRLWDIDVLIRRTLQYSLLTAVLALMYSGSVVLFQTGLRTLAGTESQVELVISTLLIAALFNPVRRRVQAIIDRRFFRQKYDSQRALEQFGERLRDEVDLAALSGTLQETVEETLRPSSMSLLLFAPRAFHSQPAAQDYPD